MRRTTSGSDVIYVFSGTQPLAEYAPGAAANSPSREYVYLGGQLIASKTSGAYTFYVRDHLSVRQVLADSNPNSPTEQGHLPFGENWYGSGNKWSFTSYERDSTSNDDYAQARRYQYTLGRFSSPDPILGSPANPQSWNRYSYVQNKPLSFVDPLGTNLKIPCYGDSCGGGSRNWGDGFGSGWNNYISAAFNSTTWDGDLAAIQLSQFSGGAAVLQDGQSRYLSIINTGWDPKLQTFWGTYEVTLDGVSTILIDPTAEQMSATIQNAGFDPNLFASLSPDNATALANAINKTGVQALQHPCFWASWTKQATIAGGGGGALKTAATEGVAGLSWGQKILGGIGAYKSVTGMMGSFYDSAVKPISNWVDSKENAVCNAIGQW